MSETTPKIGFSCAYTPLPLIEAAGLEPHRLLPVTEAPDQAGRLLHDNLCPHIKRVLDRALADDRPALAGIVFMNSCDAMRRLADAWARACPDEPQIVVDLPLTTDAGSTAHLARELERLAAWLGEVGAGPPVTVEALAAAVERHDTLARGLEALQARVARRELPGGASALQALRNRAVTEPTATLLPEVEQLWDAPAEAGSNGEVPLFLFGNVLPMPEAYALFGDAGARVVADDLCTGARQHVPLEIDVDEDWPRHLARALLARPACARMLVPDRPGDLAHRVLAAAQEAGARGVVAHVMKFCDPYLARLPMVREVLDAAGMPLLVLEGDGTLRSLGQQQTRIEAFVEMLGGAPS